MGCSADAHSEKDVAANCSFTLRRDEGQRLNRTTQAVGSFCCSAAASSNIVRPAENEGEDKTVRWELRRTLLGTIVVTKMHFWGNCKLIFPCQIS